MSGDGKPHVLVFPYPAQGHLLPLLDLTHQLCLRNITITILVTPKNLSALHPLLSLHPTIQTLVFPFPPHPDLPPGVENVRDVGNRGNIPIINALSKLHHPIIQWFKSHHNPPVAIVSDFFLGWTLQLANQLNIPRISFFSSGSFLSSVLVHCWRNVTAVHASPVVEFHDLPRSPSFKEEHLPSSFRYYSESNPEFQTIKEGSIANSESWGAIFNSFDELEGEYLEHWKTKFGNLCRRVYGVGPLNLIGLPQSLDRGNPNSGTDTEILAWLNGCPDGSVVYVCFGSQKPLNKRQMEALASGLEQSKTRFLWVVKTGTARQVDDGYGVVPDGFEERVGVRGLVVKTWAPQVVILSHRAVGGFLSHCGWNSTLEAIVAGVMVLGWPMEADQFVNARLLVDDIGAAVRVCEGGDTVPDSAELGKVIAESMSVDRPEKLKANELKDKAFAAVREGGSSSKDLAGFVKDLSNLKLKWVDLKFAIN